MFTTGNKLLNMMKEEEISIMELSRMAGVTERTIIDILAGIREPELCMVYKISVCMSLVPTRNFIRCLHKKTPLQS